MTEQSISNPGFSIVGWYRRRTLLVFHVSVPICKLLAPLVVEAKLNGAGGLRLEVPVGTLTDFATTPPWLWLIFPPMGPWALPSAVHDYLYSLPGVSRFLADAVFRELMYWRKEEIGTLTRLLFFYAVRICGKSHKATSGG